MKSEMLFITRTNVCLQVKCSCFSVLKILKMFDV